MDSKKIFLFITFCLVLSQSRQFNVTCQTCTKSCESGSVCYKIEGTGFSGEVCSTRSECQFVGTIKYNAYICVTDFVGDFCSDGICGIAHGVEQCAAGSETNSSSNSSNSSTCVSNQDSFQCSNCTQQGNCNSCLVVNASVTCIDNIHPNCQWTLRLRNQTCSEGMDNFGKQCGCCTVATVTGDIGYCSKLDLVLAAADDDDDFKLWVASGSFNSALTVSIAMLATILMILS